MMTIIILFLVSLGILCGYFIIPDSVEKHDIELLVTITLYILIFSVGLGIGQNKKIFRNLKQMGLKIIVLPIGTIIGSLFGGFITGLLINKSITISLAIASGFGWYSISAGLLTNLAGAEIGTIAFLSNVFREIMAFILIPILGKYFNPYAAISVGGATTMDTTLPLVKTSTDEKYAVVSFIHGAILSMLVPILVPFFASI